MTRGSVPRLRVFATAVILYAVYRFWTMDPQSQSSPRPPLEDSPHDENSPSTCTPDLLTAPIPLAPELESNAKYADITCAALLNGDPENDAVYARAQEYMTKVQRHRPELDEARDGNHIRLNGCDHFRTKRGYHLKAVTPEEESFPIAFNILLHNDVRQFELLLRTIYRPQNSYCVHVDSKSSEEVFDSVRAIVGCFNNVFIASKLERVVYAGYSRLQADINCMEDQLKSKIQWEYMLNIAGSEMPARTNLEMVKILKVYNGANDIEGLYGERVIRKRFEFKWVENPESRSDYKMVKTETRHPEAPYGLDILRGNSCGVFSRAFVEWVFTDPVPRALLAWSNDTQSPDEQYWATLHHTFSNPHIHPPGGYAGKPDGKAWLAKYVSWDGADPCHGRRVHSICVFGVRDLPHLISRPHFMLNKFSSSLEPLAQDCVARWIEQRVRCPTEFDTSYYEKLPFVIK